MNETKPISDFTAKQQPENENLPSRYVFDHFINEIKELRTGIQAFNQNITLLNEKLENHEEGNKTEHGEIKREFRILAGVLISIGSIFSIVLSVLAVGKEFLGTENIMIILQHFLSSR